VAGPARRAKVEQARAAVDHAFELLRKDPPRLKRLLRGTAGLADDLRAVFEDAEEHAFATRLGLVAKTLRGGALLPAALSIPLLRKAVSKLLAAAD